MNSIKQVIMYVVNLSTLITLLSVMNRYRLTVDNGLFTVNQTFDCLLTLLGSTCMPHPLLLLRPSQPPR